MARIRRSPRFPSPLFIAVCVLLLSICRVSAVWAQATLENPAPNSAQSGLGVISGWACQAGQIEIEFNDDVGTRQPASYGTPREDTAGACGDTNNGFGLLFNWNLLGDGRHTVRALADGQEFAHVTVTVTTLGQEYAQGLSREVPVTNFPGAGEQRTLVWQEAQQNFVITAGQPSQGGGTSGRPPHVLENPRPGSYQSGLGLLSGWVCEAERVELEFNNDAATRQPASYGTARGDTAGACGDTNNGFGLLFNWNLLGDGMHTVRALADGVEFARSTVTVTTLGQEYARGLSREVTVADFPAIGHDTTLVWQETRQNFVIIESDGARDVGGTEQYPLPVRVNATTAGYLETSTDVDYFEIRVAQAGTLILETTGSPATIIELWDSSGRLLARSDAQPISSQLSRSRAYRALSSHTENPRLSVQVGPGDYSVQVSGLDGDTGAYELDVEYDQLTETTVLSVEEVPYMVEVHPDWARHIHPRYMNLFTRPDFASIDFQLLPDRLSLKDEFGTTLTWCEAQPVVFATLTSEKSWFPEPYPLHNATVRTHTTPDGQILSVPNLGGNNVTESVFEFLFVNEGKFGYEERLEVYTDVFLNLFSQVELQALLATSERVEYGDVLDSGIRLVETLGAFAVYQANLAEDLAEIAEVETNVAALARARRLHARADKLGEVALRTTAVLDGLGEFTAEEDRRAYINSALLLPTTEIRMIAVLEHIEHAKDLDPALVEAAAIAYEIVAAGNASMLESIKEGVKTGAITYVKGRLTGEALKALKAKVKPFFNKAARAAVQAGKASPKVAALLGKLGLATIGGVVVGLAEIGYELWSLNDRISHFILLWNASQALNASLADADRNPDQYALSAEAFRQALYVNNTLRLDLHRWVQLTMIEDVGFLDVRLAWRLRSWWRDLRTYLEEEVARLETQELANYKFFREFDQWMEAVRAVYVPPADSECDATDNVPPATPTNLEVTADASSVTLEWDAVAGPGIRYVLYQHYSGGRHWAREVAGLSTTFSGLEADTEYCWDVVAVNAARQESAPSARQCARTGTGTVEINSAAATCGQEAPWRACYHQESVTAGQPVTFALTMPQERSGVWHGAWCVKTTRQGLCLGQHDHRDQINKRSAAQTPLTFEMPPRGAQTFWVVAEVRECTVRQCTWPNDFTEVEFHHIEVTVQAGDGEVVHQQGKVYWTTLEGKVQRADLDGSNIEDVVTGLGFPEAVAVDVRDGKVYWSDNVGFGFSHVAKIQRADLDGSAVETLVEARGQMDGLALDTVGGKLYWSNEGNGTLHRANLDGTSAENLVAGLGTLRGIALDVDGGKIYWSNLGATKIQRANLDGSNIEDVVLGTFSCGDIDLDLAADKIYWPACTEKKIWRADLDGSNVEELVATGLDGPESVAVDSRGGKMYWTDRGRTNRISRANLDGTNVEQIITLTQRPDGIALALGDISVVTMVETFTDTLRSGGVGPEMVVIPPGRFQMGCVSGRQCANTERPVHEVEIPVAFAVSKYAVTFADWDRCVAGGGCGGHRPQDNGWGRGNLPVIDVSWEDAQRYVGWLSAQTGSAYRLLSEAEWEYAARSGTETQYSWGNEIGRNRANCDGCGSNWDDDRTAPVGSFAPNAIGLHDMHGNVDEWTEDCWNARYTGAPDDGSPWLMGDCGRRILRGGSWSDLPRNVRTAHRSWGATDVRRLTLGFRVARSLP